jgi:hypothetical protein
MILNREIKLINRIDIDDDNDYLKGDAFCDDF